MSRLVIIMLVAISPILASIKIDAFGVGTDKSITKQSLYKDAILKALKAKNIDYQKNKNIIENHILIDAKRFIEKSTIVKFNKLSGFYSLKAEVYVRGEFLSQQIRQLSQTFDNKNNHKIKIHRADKEEEILECIVEGLGTTEDDAKNDAKALAFEMFGNKYDTKGSNLDKDTPVYKQIVKIVTTKFDILSSKKVRDGLHRVDISVKVEKEKIINKQDSNEDENSENTDENSKKLVDEIVENKELIVDIDKQREENGSAK